MTGCELTRFARWYALGHFNISWNQSFDKPFNRRRLAITKKSTATTCSLKKQKKRGSAGRLVGSWFCKTSFFIQNQTTVQNKHLCMFNKLVKTVSIQYWPIPDTECYVQNRAGQINAPWTKTKKTLKLYKWHGIISEIKSKEFLNTNILYNSSWMFKPLITTNGHNKKIKVSPEICESSSGFTKSHFISNHNYKKCHLKKKLLRLLHTSALNYKFSRYLFTNRFP